MNRILKLQSQNIHALVLNTETSGKGIFNVHDKILMLFLISPMNNISAQKTPGHKALYCFTQAKYILQYLKTFTFFIIQKIKKNDC